MTTVYKNDISGSISVMCTKRSKSDVKPRESRQDSRGPMDINQNLEAGGTNWLCYLRVYVEALIDYRV